MQNIDKLLRTGTYNQETKMQPVIAKFNSHCFKEKIYLQRRKINGVTVSLLMTKRRREVLTKTNYHEKKVRTELSREFCACRRK